MTLREKLLLQLAQNPNYEGKDDTEKALITELKAEMAKENKSNANSDSNVTEAATALAKELVQLTAKFQSESEKVNRKAVKQDPAEKDTNGFSLEDEMKEHTKGMNDKQKAEFKKAYRFSEFVKAMFNKDNARVKALAEGTDGQGGYLVPDEFRAELIQHILASNALRTFATVIPMDGKLLNIPKLTSDVAVYWGTENTSITTTSADFGELQLTPFRMNAIIYTSRELFDDSAISIMEILRRRFVDRVRDEENRVFINGNGTSQPKGIDQETFRSVSAGNNTTPDVITRAYYRLPEVYRSSARWLINSRAMAHLENAKDTNGAYLYPSLQAEVPTLKGRPVWVNDYVASSKIFFGDLSYYYIGDRQQVTMEVTTEGASTWEKHQVGIKVIERLDGEVALTTAFVEITNTGIN